MYMYLWETLHLLDKVRGYVIIYQSIFYEWICFIFNREFLENLDNTHTDENDTNLDEELHQVSNLIGLSPKNIYRSIYIWIHCFDKNENFNYQSCKTLSICETYSLNTGFYCGIIIVRWGSMFVDFVSFSYPRIYPQNF